MLWVSYRKGSDSGKIPKVPLGLLTQMVTINVLYRCICTSRPGQVIYLSGTFTNFDQKKTNKKDIGFQNLTTLLITWSRIALRECCVTMLPVVKCGNYRVKQSQNIFLLEDFLVFNSLTYVMKLQEKDMVYDISKWISLCSQSILQNIRRNYLGKLKKSQWHLKT